MRFLLVLGSLVALAGCKANKSAPATQAGPDDRGQKGEGGNEKGGRDDTVGSAMAGSGNSGGSSGSGGGTGGVPGHGDPYQGIAVDAGVATRPNQHDGKPVTDEVGQVIADGNLDHSLIRKEIKKRIADVNKCYEQAVATNPALAGAIVAQFTIKPDGKVAAGAKSTGVDDALGKCVTKVIEQITFPKPKNGGNVAVQYPFQFRMQVGSGR